MIRKPSVTSEVLEKMRQSHEEIVRLVQEGVLDAQIVSESLQRVVEGCPILFRFEDVRTEQAWRLFSAGWAVELELGSFRDYLESIPLVPNWPPQWHDRFDRTILVDARLPLTRICKLLHIDLIGDDETFVDFAPERSQQGVYWIRCQDGRKNHNRTIRECWKAFTPDEVGLTAVEGLALYIQDRGLLDDHFPVLPGSVLRRRGFNAFLRPHESGALLDWIWSGHSDPKYGAASRGSDKLGTNNVGRLQRMREAIEDLWYRWRPGRRDLRPFRP